MRNWLLIAGCAVAVFFAFNSRIARADWSSLGLQFEEVTDLELFGGDLYAATGDGVYRRALAGADTGWVSLGPPGVPVSAVVVLHEDTILTGHETGPYPLLRTVDGGGSWGPFGSDYGGGQFHPVLYLEQSPAEPHTLFATGVAVIAKSTNGGASWYPVWGDWNWMAMGMVFVTVDPYTPAIAWAGGEGAIFNPWLYKSTDYGETWDPAPIPYDGDNRCHDIAIYPGNSDVAWVSMEGKVIKTTDGGASWQTPLINQHYLYRVRVDSLRPDRLYTGGGQGLHLLTLFRSQDGGTSWDSLTEATYPENWLSDLLLVSSADRNVLYCGTQHGVFGYTDIVQFACGDVDGSGNITASDIVTLINYVFKGGPAPSPDPALADVNCSRITTAADIIWLVNFVFKSGSPPCTNCLLLGR